MNKKKSRIKRCARIRKKVHGTLDIPRLCVFKSLKHVYAQVINDEEGRTLLTESTISKELRDIAKGKNNIEICKKVGVALAEKAKEIGLKKMVFDRRGYKYHGRIKTLVESIREAGIKI